MAPERVAQSEAVTLLLERAGEAGRALELTHDNRAAVVELTRRLDGIPLAIELAAVRLRSLGQRAVAIHSRGALQHRSDGGRSEQVIPSRSCNSEQG
jgi:predicted ATPase